MGLYFRKSFGKGPFRTTISKSGVSVSVGGKGIRVGSYASTKSKKSTKKKSTQKKQDKKQYTYSSTTESKNAETNKFGWKMLAWVCRIIWIPMILLGALLALVEPTVGIMAFVAGIFEFIYSHQYFKKNKLTKETTNNDTKLMEVQNHAYPSV